MFYTILYILVLTFVLLLGISAAVHMVYLVPFVPTRKKVVAKMIEVANLKTNHTVIDLGCGDGRLLFAAEKSGENIRGMGFEIAPLMYVMAQINKLFYRSRVQIHFKNLFTADLKEADVIFCYLFPSVMEELAEKIKKECKPGTQIISNTFRIQSLPLTTTHPKDDVAGLPSIHVYTV